MILVCGSRAERSMTDEGLIEHSGAEICITDFGNDALAARVAYIAETARKVPRPEVGYRS